MMNRKYVLVLVAAMLPTSAFAYVDPGSGMLIWQGLIAVVGVVVMFVREPIKTLKRWFRRDKQ